MKRCKTSIYILSNYIYYADKTHLHRLSNIKKMGANAPRSKR